MGVNPASIANLHTVPTALERLAEERGSDVFLHDACEPQATEYSFASVVLEMQRVASALREARIRPGDHVAILAPNGAFLLFALLGAQRCGAASIVLYPPGVTRAEGTFADQLRDQLARADVAALLVADEYEGSPLIPSANALPRLKAVLRERDIKATSAAGAGPLPTDGRALAHLQFTSGSTGRQRGVLLSHENLLQNVRAIASGLSVRPQDRVVSWLPLAHDFGLIGAMLMPLLAGLPLWLTRPNYFVLRPLNWLRALSDFRATLTFSPNFGFQRCVNAVRPSDCAGLDLSCLRLAVCAAEPILKTTIDAFWTKFRPFGLNDSAFCPAYGLAEATVGVTAAASARGVDALAVDYDALVQDRRAVTQSTRSRSVFVYPVGAPLPGIEVEIVDDQERSVPDGQVGEVVVRGPSVALGYYGDPPASARTFTSRGLRTGDTGFVLQGELFVTGRKKELIIHAGRNYHPQDIEAAVLSIEGIQQAAAFGILTESSGTEAIAVLAATRVSGEERRADLIESCRRAVLDQLGVSLENIALVLPHTIPKTSSGKLRRGECQRIYHDLTRGNHERRTHSSTTA